MIARRSGRDVARPGRVAAIVAAAALVGVAGCAGPNGGLERAGVQGGERGGERGGAQGRSEGRSGGETSAEPGDAVCHEGVLRVSGAQPFAELTLVPAEGAPVDIAPAATELAALTGATVRLCVTSVPVEASSDITAFDVIAVDGVPAVLGVIDDARVTRSATGESFGVRASAAVLAGMGDGCVWVAGSVEGDAVALSSWGSAPASLCEMAAR